MDYMNDNIYVVDYLSIFLQNHDFSLSQIKVVKKMIEETVIPLVNLVYLRTPEQCGENLRKSYNIYGNHEGLPYGRSMQEVFALVKCISWCNCSTNSQV